MIEAFQKGMNRLPLSRILGLLFFILALSFPQNLLAGGVVISDASEDGTVTLERGPQIKLWGLRFTDLDSARDFLIGRTIRCEFLLNTLELRIGDCIVEPRMGDYAVMRSWLDLYSWTLEFGFSEHTCKETELPYPIIFEHSD